MPAKKTKASHDRIRIQMMNEFVIYINERRAEHMANKSKKGLALIGFLIANRNVSVTNQRLMYTFWADERVTNPENALKNAGQPRARHAQPDFAGAGQLHRCGPRRVSLAVHARYDR